MGYFDMENNFEEDGLNSESSFDMNDLPENSGNEHQAERIDFESYNQDLTEDNITHKSIAKFAIIGGIVILAVALLFIGVTNKKKASNKQVSTPKQQQVESNNNDKTVESNEVLRTDNWVELTEAEAVEFNGTVESTLTVTSIKYYASQKSDGSIEVKSTVTGNISGLIGTYTMDISYSKGLRVRLGNQLKVKYSIASMNNKTVIDNLVLV